KGHAPDVSRCAAAQAADLLTAVDVPYPDTLVGHLITAASGEHPAAIRREAHTDYRVGVSLKAAQLLARLEVPETDRVVVAARQSPLAIRREGDAVDFFAMPFQAANFALGLQVPEPDRAVVTSRERVPTVGRQGDTADPAAVARQALELLATFHIP